MPYTYNTSRYQIPYMGDGDAMNASQERIAHQIIENQLRGGILASGGNRVLDEGTYTAQTLADNSTTVTLSGSPALRGFANEGYVEVFGFLRWNGLQADTIYNLYVKATADTYVDIGNVTPIASVSEITQNDHLFLAQIDTTGATPSTPPTVDSSPQGKATAFNLFQLLNSNVDPFGAALTQSILTVLQQFTVRLGKDKTALFQQLNPDATLPVISIENEGDNPEIKSSGELRLADVRIPAGFALSDAANSAYQGTAQSVIGALNEILNVFQDHINDSDDPHGETLTQTRLVLREFLSLPKLVLTPPPPGPPGPPGSPPIPEQDCEIESTGELRFCDVRAHIALSEPGEDHFAGDAESLIGALNELLGLIVAISSLVNGLIGNNLPAISPLTFEVNPDDADFNLHFRFQLAEDDEFSVVQIVKESKESTTGWWYEYQPPAPPLSPEEIGPDRLPGALPGEIIVPLPAALPTWEQLPTLGLPAELQKNPDGRPVRVQYRWQNGDNIFLRRHYRAAVQQYNLEYGDAELASLTFG